MVGFSWVVVDYDNAPFYYRLLNKIHRISTTESRQIDYSTFKLKKDRNDDRVVYYKKRRLFIFVYMFITLNREFL